MFVIVGMNGYIRTGCLSKFDFKLNEDKRYALGSSQFDSIDHHN